MCGAGRGGAAMWGGGGAGRGGAAKCGAGRGGAAMWGGGGAAMCGAGREGAATCGGAGLGGAAGCGAGAARGGGPGFFCACEDALVVSASKTAIRSDATARTMTCQVPVSETTRG